VKPTRSANRTLTWRSSDVGAAEGALAARGGSGDAATGVESPPRAVPHSPQKRTVDGFGAPHAGHEAARRPPHWPQNFRFASFSVPQFAQINAHSKGTTRSLAADGPSMGVRTLAAVVLSRPLAVPYRVRFDECGPDGSVRASSLLRYVQDAAWVHSDAAGFGRDWYREQELTWLIRAQSIDVEGGASYGEVLTVTTEVVGWRRMWARRRTTMVTEAGAPVATALTDWVLLGRRGPVRIPEAIHGATGDKPDFVPIRLRGATPPPEAIAAARKVRTSDLDPMGHVNNAVYVDYLEGGVARAGGVDDVRVYPRRYTAEYVGSAEPDDELRDGAWQDGGGWAYALVEAARGELFRGRLELL
jgi:acyl-CoA thioesterase FadM